MNAIAITTPINNSDQETQDEQTAQAEQHSIAKTLLLHLLPGAFIYGIFLLTAPLFEAWNYPGIMGLLFGSLVVLLPIHFMLHIIGKKHSGKFSLQGAILYRQPLRWWQYLLGVLGSVAYILLVTIFIVPLFQGKIIQFFTWWPGYAIRLSFGHYPAQHILIAEIGYIILNALLPITEELYFRGYLMPRISRFKNWTPFISMTLFSLYHFWQPWNNISNLLELWPLTYLPWKTRNTYLAIGIHCTINIIGMLPLIFIILK